MDRKNFAKELEQRTRRFAVNMIRLSITLPNTPEGKIVRNQLTKAGTSIGANYREANRSRSKADFKNKIKICESEASETVYWLEIIKSLNWIDEDHIKLIIDEAIELLALFSSIGKTLKL